MKTKSWKSTTNDLTELWRESDQKVKKMAALAHTAYAYVNNPQEIEVWLDEIIRVANEVRPTTRVVDLLDSSAKSALVAQPANH
jgi:hypothetical protein